METKKEWIYNIEFIAFSGGGVRALAHVGAYQRLQEVFALENKSLYKQCKGFSGTSCGALVALMAVLGLDALQMVEHTLAFDSKKIWSHMEPLEFATTWGLYNKTDITHEIHSLLEKHLQNRNITFAELAKHTGKSLMVNATCLTDAKVVYFSDVTSPDLEVWRAIVASTSIPILFTPSHIGDKLYVDGGILRNLPIDPLPMDRSLVLHLTSSSWTGTSVNGVKDFIMRNLYLPLNELEKIQIAGIPEQFRNRIIRIDTKEISSLNFHLNNTEKQRLLKMGKLAIDQIQTTEQSVLKNTILCSLLKTVSLSLHSDHFLAEDQQGDDNNNEQHHQ